MTQAPFCLSVNMGVNVRLLSRSDAPFSCVGHTIVMPCRVLISMHDMQEFSGEHLNKLAFSSTEAKGQRRREKRKGTEGWARIVEPVCERTFGRLPKNVM